MRYPRIFFEKIKDTFFLLQFSILIAIYLPYRRADLTASASLQGIRGEGIVQRERAQGLSPVRFTSDESHSHSDFAPL